jgi:hypothetical protein
MSGEQSGRTGFKLVPVQVMEDLEKRFKGFPVPGGRFDPSTASPQLLRKYGLPPRPDTGCQKLLRQAWDRGFGRALRLQEFRFHLDLVEDTQYRLFTDQAVGVSFEGSRFETSSNWSGAYITANQDRQFLQIWGTWTIPGNLQLPPVPQRGPAGIPYICANWIGLDGQRQYLDSSLPQMGTVSIRQADGTTTAQAWIQWWASGVLNSAPLPLGLAVNPGNEVLCVLTAWDPQTVICVMVNLSSNVAMAVQGTAPSVTLPDGTMVRPSIAGATAEWIVERPKVPDPAPGQQPTSYNFPDYGEAEFGLCVAVEGDGVDIFSLFNGLPQQLQGARRIRMFDVLSNPARTVFISMPRKLDDTSIRVRYGSF